MGTESPVDLVIADTSVLINFLRLDRMDLLKCCAEILYITDHVCEEVSELYPDQRACLNKAIADNVLQVYRVESPEELALMVAVQRGRRSLAIGEASAIAAAQHHGWVLAIDDKAALNFCRSNRASIRLLRTADVFISLIRKGMLTVSEADAIKDDLAENHSFRMKLRSFADVV